MNLDFASGNLGHLDCPPVSLSRVLCLIGGIELDESGTMMAKQ